MIQAEILKIRTGLSMKVAALVAVAGLLVTQLISVTLIPAISSGAIDIGEDLSELGEPGFGSRAFQFAALSPLGGGAGGAGTLSIAMVAIVLLGVFVATTDHRFGGIVITALAEPRRLRIVGAKVLATSAVAAALGVTFLIICVATLMLSATVLSDAGLLLTWGEIGVTALKAVAVTVLMALLGLAVGVIARSQLAGVLVAISLLVAEPIVQAFAALFSGGLPVWAQVLPLSLGQAAIASGESGAGFPPALALLLLAVITALSLGVAGGVFRRRDL